MAGSTVFGAPRAALLCGAAKGIVAEMAARQIGLSVAAETSAAAGGSGMR
jgi:hypothetical protein